MEPSSPTPREAPSEAPRRRRHRSRKSATPGARVSYSDLAQRASLALFALSVVGSVLAIGTVHTTTLLVVAAAVFASTALAIYAHASAPTTAGPVSLSAPVLAFIALAAYTLLQAIPIPIGLLHTIAPANADVWERVLLPFAEPPLRWASLSLDPGASIVEVLRWTVYAAVFATAAAVSAKRGAPFGVALVFVSAVAAALTTVGHGLASATRVFGLYQPAFAASSWHIGPLLNPNNLAGYLNLGALAGLGLILTRKPILPAWLVGAGVMLIVAVDVTSASRGGVIVLPVGVVLLALITRARGGGSERTSSAATWLVAIAVVGGAILAILGATRDTWSELLQKDLSKIEMIAWAKPLLRDHPWFGVGRGAFESVFPVYRTSPGNVVYTHAENFPLQWASEWGIPVAIAALAFFAWAFSPGRLGVTRSAAAAGGWVGVMVVLLQNMLDLALEVPGVCIAIAVVLGSLWGDGRRRNLPRAEAAVESPTRGIRIAGAVGAVGLILIAIAGRYRRLDVVSDRTAIGASYKARSVQYPEEARAIRAEIRAAMIRHPAEPYFPLIGALVAVRARDQNPMPWLQHTLERGQVNGRAHLLLAEVLHARGAAAQAFFELRLSVESDGALSGPAADLAVRWTKSFDEIVSAAPEGKAGANMLDAIAGSLDPAASGALEERLSREVIARDPSLVSARYRVADLRLRSLAGQPPTGICADRDACRREVLAQAEAIASDKPDLSLAALLRARLLVTDGKPDDAEHLLAVECVKMTDRVPCLQARVQIASQIKDADRLTAAAKDLLAVSCNTPAICADASTAIGDIRAGRGEANLALGMYERAARVDPSEERWLKLADAASRAGAHLRAADALEQVARRRGGHDPDLKKRIDDEQRKAMLPGP